MRLHGAYTALGYKSASVERRGGHATASGGSGDSHLRHDRELLGRMADRFERDSGIYAGILERWTDAILGPEGFALKPKTKSKRLNQRIYSDWQRFGELTGSDGPEVRGLFDWRDIERLSLRAIANHGDVGAILTNRGRFQFVEGEEITGGKLTDAAKAAGSYRIEQGVELDQLGAPLAYHVAARSESGLVDRRKTRRIPRADFVLPANLRRYSQTRGVPVLTQTFSMIHRLSDVCDSEAIAWQSLAKFALAITRENSPELAHAETIEDEDGADPSETGDVANRIAELEEAIIFYAKPGESVTAIERDLPGKNFPESVRMFLRLIGLPLGLPLEVILLDYSRTNYSSARAALEQAYRMFRCWQSFLKRKHHSPLYRAWLRWQVEAKRYPDRPDLYDHEWGAPEFPWVDALKESEAWGNRMDRGLATHGDALDSINRERSGWLREREAEVLEAIQTAERINAAHPGANVDWRHFAGLEVSKQAQLEAPRSSSSSAGGQAEDGQAGEDADA